MGKVVINEHDATQTASKKSSSDQATNRKSNQQSQVKISRFHESASNVGAKMNTKSKNATSSKIAVNDSKLNRQDRSGAVKAKPVARMNGKDIYGLPAGSSNSSEAKSGKKIITQAKIVERTQVRVPGKGMQINDISSQKKPTSKLDPELALLANRASAAERTRVDTFMASKLGMVGDARRTGMSTAATARQKNPHSIDGKPKNEDLRFTKLKSALIGIGVAAVVAIIGFAAIGIFGNHKNMCTILFESNGGTKVAGTEIVCGRTVKQPDNPTKEGFSFEGWTFEGEEFDFANTPLYQNSTLVARWKANDDTEIVRVTLDPNGGSMSMLEIEVAKGKKISENSLSTPSRPGYVFEDWFLGDQPYDFEQPVEADITLRAEWTKQEANTNNNNNSNNTSTPAPAKVASIEAAGDLTIEIGKSTTINVNVLPSAANYTLVATSSDDAVASCSVGAKTAITCTAKATGTVTVQVRDSNSGVSTRFKITVPANDPPPITGGDDNPPVSGGNTGGSNNSGNTGGNEGGDNNGGDGDNETGDNEGGNTGDNNGDGSNTGGDNSSSTDNGSGQ